ncbi:MAG: carbonic anhydrase [Planctomycetaceae bacterium]|jgi:carbonic anhydrase|nr:carbonic anhydrase [Planctomycetaceae bacterium]
MKTTAYSFCFLVLLSFSPFTLFTAADDHGHSAGITPDEALKRLQEGNERFAAGKAEHPNCQPDRVKETAEHGQHPVATILACSDSRVPLEVVFDQGVGDIFAIKVAGNVSGASQLGSIEYGVAHTGTALVVVLGHTKCGAVTAACTDGGHEGSVESLMQSIAPAVKRIQASTGKTGKEAIEPVCLANIYYQIEALFAGSEILREAVKSGKVKVVGAVYDVETGKAEFYGPHPKTDDLLNGKTVSGIEPQSAEPVAAAVTPEVLAKSIGLGTGISVPAPAGEKTTVKTVISVRYPAARPGSFRDFMQKKGSFMGR